MQKQLDLRPKPLLAGEDEEGWDIMRCPECGFEGAYYDWDCVGAEPDGLLCIQCNTEIVV